MMYLAYALLTLQMFVGIFLIILILLQRGRGGGLAGSFGGMGGQSAFGTKAGDIFTRVTIFVAVFWFLLSCACILVVRSASTGRFKPGVAEPAVNKAPAVSPLEGAKDKGEGDATIDLPIPAKSDAANDTEKPPEGAASKPEAEAAENKKPDGDDAAPPVKKSEDAPAEAKEKDQEKPATTDSADSKKPE